MEIEGKIVYRPEEGGCWGIVDTQNKKWRVTNMPSALQKEGLQVKARTENVQEAVSMFMWGRPVRLVDYQVV
jgi:hypothetical protein